MYDPADRYSKDYIENVLQPINKYELSKVPIIFSLLLTNSNELKVRATKVLLESIPMLNNLELSKLDHLFRERTSLDWPYDWKNESPENLLLPGMTEEEKIIILGLCSLHPNGYFREKALNLLGAYESGKEFPFLIIRCNDWVREVRETARMYIENRLTTKNVKYIVHNLPLFFKLKNSKRNDQNNLFDQVVHLLSKKESLPFLDKGTKSPISKTRYFCYQILIYTNIFDKKLLFHYLKLEKEPYYRLFLLNEIMKEISMNEFTEYYSTLKRDKFPIIRARALEKYYSLYPEKSIHELENALLDKSGTIRSLARFLLKKQNDTDLASFYSRNILNGNKNLLGAILGLGEVGNKEHVTLIIPFLNHENISIIKATIHAILLLDGERHKEKFIKMLNHHHKGISKAAKRAIAAVYYTNMKDELYRLYMESSYAHAKYNAALLLCSLPKWEAINYILQFYFDTDHKDISNLGELQYINWLAHFNRTFDSPSKIQIDSIKNLIEKNKSKLEKANIKELEFLIKGF